MLCCALPGQAATMEAGTAFEEAAASTSAPLPSRRSLFSSCGSGVSVRVRSPPVDPALDQRNAECGRSSTKSRDLHGASLPYPPSLAWSRWHWYQLEA